jgi:hypothetical protein
VFRIYRRPGIASFSADFDPLIGYRGVHNPSIPIRHAPLQWTEPYTSDRIGSQGRGITKKRRGAACAKPAGLRCWPMSTRRSWLPGSRTRNAFFSGTMPSSDLHRSWSVVVPIFQRFGVALIANQAPADMLSLSAEDRLREAVLSSTDFSGIRRPLSNKRCEALSAARRHTKSKSYRTADPMGLE